MFTILYLNVFIHLMMFNMNQMAANGIVVALRDLVNNNDQLKAHAVEMLLLDYCQGTQVSPFAEMLGTS